MVSRMVRVGLSICAATLGMGAVQAETLTLNDAAGGTFAAPEDATYTAITFGSNAGAYTVTGSGITLNGALTNASAAVQTIASPLTVGGSFAPAVGGGLTLANVTAGGSFAPQGAGGAVTMTGTSTFSGPLVLKGNPLVVTPRVYTSSGWSKDLAGTANSNVQITYWLRGDGANTFTAFNDTTRSQAGDVVIFEGSNTFTGNVMPVGNDSYMVVRGAMTAANMNWTDRGYNTRLYVESGASLTVTGGFVLPTGTPSQLYVDGTMTAARLDLRHASGALTSPKKTGVYNVGSLLVTTLTSSSMKDFTLNLGGEGLSGGGVSIGNLVMGPLEASGTKFAGSYVLNGTTLRAATPAGAAAAIRMFGVPQISGTATKTGAGDLILEPSTYDNLTGTIDVSSGRVLCAADGTLKATLNLAAGTAFGVTAGHSVAVQQATFSGTSATLVFGANADGVGALTLAAGALDAVSAVTIVLDGAPVAGTTATLVSGAQLADASKFTLSAPEGTVGSFAVEDGNLVLSVTQSATQAAKAYVWTGAASSAWDLSAANWLDGETAAAFTAAANAFFTGTDEGDGAVAVDANGVEAHNVTFDAAKTYTLTGGQIAGDGTVTVKGGATVVMAGATLDQQEVVVTNGTLQVGAVKVGMLGDSTKWITIKDGGAFDIHSTSNSTEALRTTFEKCYRIAGAGPDGAGAIVNRGTLGGAYARLHTVHLMGDATIATIGPRSDVRVLSGSTFTGRPDIYGPTNTLTMKGPGVGKSGSTMCFVDADINLGKLRLTDNATVGFESSTKESISNGVEIANSYMTFWSRTSDFSIPVRVTDGTGRIGNGWGNANVTGSITVEDGTTLKLQGGNGASTRYVGGIFGSGSILVAGDQQKIVSDVEQSTLTSSGTGAFAIYGDNSAAGNAKKWPKNVTITNNGYLVFAPSTNSVYSGYTIKGGGSGYFNPSWQGSNKTDAVSGMPLVKNWAKIPVTTVENTTFENANIAMGLGHTGLLVPQCGAATLGTGFVGRNLLGILLGAYNTQPDSSTLTLAGGSSVAVNSGGEIELGQWSGTTNNIHRLIVDGGTLDASVANPIRVGYDTRAAEFLVKSGTAKLHGVSLRHHNTHNMTADAAGIGYEVFSMSGGTVELDGSFTTERVYPWTPQIWLGGGTLKSLSNWSNDFYQVATFEPWGDATGTNTFTLDTNGKTVTYKSALQGNSNVRIIGSGSFTADYNVQGGVSGHWSVENTGTANLKNAAAFAAGLTLTNGASASIDIGARTNYVGLAVGCNGNSNLGNNPFTVENFYSHGSVFSSLVTKNPQKLITLTATPSYTVFRTDAEFYVDEATNYTFGVTYDDRGDIVVDGVRVAYNSAWNNVGVGTVALAAGWHRLSLTCKDNAGGAGPTSSTTYPNQWRTAGMAAGFHKGATTSQSPAEYEPIHGKNLKMRPASTVRWMFRYIGSTLPSDWRSPVYDFSMVTNSMQKIHDTGWNSGKLAINAFSGWTYVEPQDVGTWTFDGVYDDAIYVALDGQKVFENTTWNGAKSSTATVTAGWHSFLVVVGDKGGGISWSGVSGYGAALYVKRPSDSAKVPFDERKIRMSADPYGFIGGELQVCEGSTLTNASDTPCDLTGTVTGTGTLKGPYALSGTWKLAMDDGRTLKTVNFADGVDLKNGTLDIALAKRPVSAKYALCPVSGLDGLTQDEIDAKLNVTLAGAAYANGLSLVVEDGKAVLKNLKPTGTVFFLR